MVQSGLYNAEIYPKDADGMANSADPDQTCSYRSSLTWVYTVCLDLIVVALLFYVQGKHLRSCRDGQLT